MWAYARATLREVVFSPFAWGLLAVGVFAGWFSATLAILAISEIEPQAEALVTSTSLLFGALMTLTTIGRSLDEDSVSGFTLAADATAPGPGGRMLGRWAGGTTAGAALALGTAMCIAWTGAIKAPNPLWLLYTNIISAALVGAWAVLLGTRWNAGAVTMTVLLLWVLGHLPWAAESFLGGPVGRALAAWLPGPREPHVALGAALHSAAGITGLLLLTFALLRPAEPRS